MRRLFHLLSFEMQDTPTPWATQCQTLRSNGARLRNAASVRATLPQSMRKVVISKQYGP